MLGFKESLYYKAVLWALKSPAIEEAYMRTLVNNYEEAQANIDSPEYLSGKWVRQGNLISLKLLTAVLVHILKRKKKVFKIYWQQCLNYQFLQKTTSID